MRLIILLFAVLAVSGCVKQQHNTEFFGPQDRIDYEKWNRGYYSDIEFGKVVLEHAGSMRPFSDVGSDIMFLEHKRAIEIKPLAVGDVIIYKKSDGGERIHRIIGINFDELGKYYTTKGDNNWFKDSERVRESDVRLVVVGVLY